MICAVTGCSREVVRGRFGGWAHTTNPGRDHHYARPASRPTADDLSGPLGGLTREDAPLSIEARDVADTAGTVRRPAPPLSGRAASRLLTSQPAR